MPAEKRPSGRSSRGRWLAVGLLVAPGFALGAGAGLLWEEPRLLASYLLGGTEEVAWASGSGGGEEVEGRGVLSAALEPELPQVAAAPEPAAPEPKTAPPPAAKPAPPAKPKPAGRPVASAAGGRFVVQVGAFGEKASAERLAGDLRSKGYDVRIHRDESGGARWKVRVGPLATREAGERAASRLEREEKLPTWVFEEAT